MILGYSHASQMLHYVVTMQACLYNDVEQWLNQLLEYDHISEGSMHKFKSVREQVSTQSILILASIRSVVHVV